MAFNLENMTIDYKQMLRMVPSDRATLAQSGTISDLVSSLTPGQLVNLFPRYYRDQLPDIGQAVSSLGGALSEPSKYVGGGGGGGGGGGDGGGTVPYVPPELSIEKQTAILAKAGIDVTVITGSIGPEGLSIDDERVKALRNLSDNELASSGLQKVQTEDGKTLIKKVAPEALQLSDEAALDKYKKTFPPTTFSPKERATLDFIAKREGASDPDVVFGGNRYKERLGLDKKPLTERTISEVINEVMPKLRELSKADGYGRLDNGRVVGTSAVGTGQMIEGTLVANLRALGIPEDQWDELKFDKHLQERLTLQNFKSSGIGDPNADPSTWDHQRLGAQYESLNRGRGHSGMTQAEAAAIENASSERPKNPQEDISPQEAKQKLAELETQQEQDSLTQTLYKKQTQGQPTAFEGKMGESSASDFYNNMRGQYPEKLDINSDIWNQVDPELAKARNSIVDAETGLVGRDALLAADASAKVLRKNNYIPRIASGGDNHSENHGSGRDANYSIDMAASVVNDQGKVVPISLGQNMPEQIKNDMATAAHFASVGAGGGHRVGYPDKSSPHSMHIQQDPDRRSAYWGYSETGKRMGVESSTGAALRATEEGRRFLEERETISRLTPEQAASYFDTITGFTPKAAEQAAQEVQQTPTPVNADPVTSALSRVEGQPSEAAPVPVSPIDPVQIPSDTQQTTTTTTLPVPAPEPVANRPEVRSFASGGTVPMTPGENVAGINTDTGKLEFMSNDRELYTKDDNGNLRIDPSTIRQEDQKAEIAPAESQRAEPISQPMQSRPEQPMPVSTPDPNFLETMSFGSMASSPSQLRALNRAKLYGENSGNLVNGHFS